jgi:P4 family phage/plasmid primase-like protien
VTDFDELSGQWNTPEPLDFSGFAANPTLAPDKWQDVDRANELARQHGRLLAFVPEEDTWWVCDPSTGLWSRDPKAVAVRGLLRTYTGTTTDRQEMGALRAAQVILSVPAAKFVENQDVLHLHGNRVIQIGNQVERPVAPEDYCRYSLDIDVDEEELKQGKRLLWQFLSYVLPHAEVRDWVVRFWGYCLWPVLDEQVCLVLHGPPDTGKSTLAMLMQSTLGQYADLGARSLLLASRFEEHPTAIMKLEGKRLVRFNELPAAGKLDEERLKQLVSPDPIPGRRMRQDYGADVPVTWKVVVTTNNLPEIENPDDDAIWKRLVVVPMREKLSDLLRDNPLRSPTNDEVLNVPDQFVKLPEVRAAALSVALGGLKQLHDDQRLLPLPDQLHAVVREYRASQDDLAEFVERYLVLYDEDRDPTTGAASITETWERFYKHYLGVGDPDLKQWSQVKLTRRLRKWLIGHGRSGDEARTKVGGEPVRYWKRVGLRVPGA